VAHAPKPSECFLWHHRKNFTPEVSASSRALKDEIVAVMPLKAEGAPAPGAGFSLEAVPGNSVGNEEHQNHQLTPPVNFGKNNE
jgi:hypothetical protein